jgi:hypothetical protein
VNDDDQRAVTAAGAMTEALETLERARGHLYSFHQLVGEADFKLDEVLDGLRELGRTDLADQLQRELVGRDVLPGRWTFQVMEEFDDGYYAVFRAQEQAIRDALTDGRRHVLEAQMKAERQPEADR